MTNTGTAISIRNISKSYRKNITRKKFYRKPCEGETFLAVDNISIDINKGEVVCISGQNGSGKSTLLKMIAEVTPPSSGEIEIDGKVASILEIGIGFQPELSGYDNIFLSGAMYGLTKSEIEKKSNKIVELFGFPDFINTPVKYYSSGMYMRLAFSIIVNIDADIYLFDEVTSVGDAEFRNKVVREITRLKSQNATILIVTHSPTIFSKISDKFILFSNGKIKVSDSLENALACANTTNDPLVVSAEIARLFKEIHEPSTNFDISEIHIETPSNDYQKIFDEDITIATKASYSSDKETVLMMTLCDITGNIITSAQATLNPGNYTDRTICFRIPKGYLRPAPISLNFEILDNDKKMLASYTNIMNMPYPKREKWTGYINLPISVSCD